MFREKIQDGKLSLGARERAIFTDYSNNTKHYYAGVRRMKAKNAGL